jgi:hypothetical protein
VLLARTLLSGLDPAKAKDLWRILVALQHPLPMSGPVARAATFGSVEGDPGGDS